MFPLNSCAPVSPSSAGVMSRRGAVSSVGRELLQQQEGAARPSALLEIGHWPPKSHSEGI